MSAIGFAMDAAGAGVVGVAVGDGIETPTSALTVALVVSSAIKASGSVPRGVLAAATELVGRDVSALSSVAVCVLPTVPVVSVCVLVTVPVVPVVIETAVPVVLVVSVVVDTVVAVTVVMVVPFTVAIEVTEVSVSEVSVTVVAETVVSASTRYG